VLVERIGPKPRQEIIRRCADRIVTTKALIKSFRAPAERFCELRIVARNVQAMA